MDNIKMNVTMQLMMIPKQDFEMIFKSGSACRISV